MVKEYVVCCCRCCGGLLRVSSSIQRVVNLFHIPRSLLPPPHPIAINVLRPEDCFPEFRAPHQTVMLHRIWFSALVPLTLGTQKYRKPNKMMKIIGRKLSLFCLTGSRERFFFVVGSRSRFCGNGRHQIKPINAPFSMAFPGIKITLNAQRFSVCNNERMLAQTVATFVLNLIFSKQFRNRFVLEIAAKPKKREDIRS